VLVVFASLSRSMPLVLGGWVGRLAGKTQTRLDDHLVEQLDGAAGRVALTSGLWLAWAALGLDGGVDAFIGAVLLLGVVFTGAILAFEAACAVFAFFADPHDEPGRTVLPAFERFFQRLAGTLVALIGVGVALMAVGVAPVFAGAALLAATAGVLAGVMGPLRQWAAGLGLLLGEGWRPGDSVQVAGYEGTLREITPAGIRLDAAEGTVWVSHRQAAGVAVVTATGGRTAEPEDGGDG
jgi:small-conductance mechanosensitive channel